MPVLVETTRVGRRTDSASVAEPAPCLTWITRTTTRDWMQVRAQIELDGTQTATVEGGDSVAVAWPFAPLEPRSTHAVRVRVTGPDGETSDWSDPFAFTTAFLAPGEWIADMIGLATPTVEAQPALLRTEFALRGGIARATLYATAQGVYDVFINGDDVDDEILKPGWTPYRDRLIHETTDVTALLREGANAIGVMLAGGWYTERFGFGLGPAPFYGEQPTVALQLVVDYADGSTETIVSDAAWQTTADGPILRSGIYHGEHYDARRAVDGWASPGFSADGWSAASVRPTTVVPTARTSPAVRAIEERAVEAVVESTSGGRILDFGQNLVGRLRIRVRGSAGITLTLRHAEVLEHGELGTRPLRAAEATDRYTLGGGEEVWEPRFTFHGFRYAEITGGEAPIAPEDVTAVVIHSDLRRTGWLETSHPLLDRLHENVVWGMKGNFLYLPTDCPQRDERLGWTGDIQVFAPTASYLYDVDAFLSSWLTDLALEQRAAGGGSVPFIVPNVLWDAAAPAAAWGDAATVVPSVLHERYGDLDTLRVQLPSMRGWADRLLGIAGDRYLWEGGFQFGDWLDPSAPPENPFLARTDHDVVASAHLYRSVALVAAAARALGDDALAGEYGEKAERVHRAFVGEYVTASGRLVSDTETAYAMAIRFGLFRDDAQRQAMGDRLAELVRRDGYRITTGFVGTPLITDALSDTGHAGVAARLLFQTENPSWLYPVTMGATTIWERWDSMLEDGTINPGEMTSFNHYALGAVADWLHRRVGGIAPAAPGYRTVRIAPIPLDGLDFARAALDGPYGRIGVEWKREGGSIRLTAAVPPNTTAEVHVPGATEAVTVGSGSHEWIGADPHGARPPLTLASSTASVIDDPDAFALITAAIDGVHGEYAERFRARTRWADDITITQALAAYPEAVAAAVAEAVEGTGTRAVTGED
jgi:alpha-L-rhamnosidase